MSCIKNESNDGFVASEASTSDSEKESKHLRFSTMICRLVIVGAMFRVLFYIRKISITHVPEIETQYLLGSGGLV
jgi:hypothetical protein